MSSGGHGDSLANLRLGTQRKPAASPEGSEHENESARASQPTLEGTAWPISGVSSAKGPTLPVYG